MPSLAIIGTAGRKDDAARLSVDQWELMRRAAIHVIGVEKADSLVSGGAAWADHVAVRLFLDGVVGKLDLHLPAQFVDGQFSDSGEMASPQKPGRTLNHYHGAFSRVMGFDSLQEVGAALAKSPACYHTVCRGFHARNAMVASTSTAYLAMTFGNGRTLKQGGTADTARSFRARVANGGMVNSWHLDLTTGKLYAGAVAPERQ